MSLSPEEPGEAPRTPLSAPPACLDYDDGSHHVNRHNMDNAKSVGQRATMSESAPFDDRAIARRIRETLDAKSMTPNELSVAAEISGGWLSRFLRGERDNLELTTFVRIAVVLGVSADWLLSGAGTAVHDWPVSIARRVEADVKHRRAEKARKAKEKAAELAAKASSTPVVPALSSAAETGSVNIRAAAKVPSQAPPPATVGPRPRR